MQFINPKNGFVVTKSVPWLWCILFGPLYFLVSGIFSHALVMFLIAATLYVSMGAPATLLVILLDVIYSAFAGKIITNNYLSKGWSVVQDGGASKSVAAEGIKICPYCAEEVRQAAIVCKHCGKELTLAVAE